MAGGPSREFAQGLLLQHPHLARLRLRSFVVEAQEVEQTVDEEHVELLRRRVFLGTCLLLEDGEADHQVAQVALVNDGFGRSKTQDVGCVGLLAVEAVELADRRSTDEGERGFPALAAGFGAQARAGARRGPQGLEGTGEAGFGIEFL